MKCVNQQQASKLLHNKFVVVLGDSIQRSVYKDLVLLLQKEKYLTGKQLKSKGELSFEEDCLVEGGCLSLMHNGTQYREVRQFQSAHHLVRFYFVTRIYSRYMQSILDDFRHGLKPDVVIVNSCVWDISRYNPCWMDDYEENLCKFFDELRRILPEETLVIWNLAMPLAEKIKGGFLVPEIEHKAPHLRHDVIEANFYSGTLADAYNLDVLDLHFQFRFSLHHHTKDGVHWNAIAHRRITFLLLQHIAAAWGVIMPCLLTAVGNTEVTVKGPSNGNATRSAVRHRTKTNSDRMEEFYSDSLPYNFMSFDDKNWHQQNYRHEAAGVYKPTLSRQRHSLVYRHGHVGNDFHYRPPHHFEPYRPYNEHHQYVMRSTRRRYHYAPYTHHRSKWDTDNGR
ncbi:PC-esterase domain-containing protein 1A [Echeneis naucrates]|uniref:PC-esterase domain-containing protein 1A n=1 Tax=Echeneis naucrates TaxID=173247 RepID=UPI00111382F5|nr:PC-esterase domain-containing protein 1A-like [Echeneis naucrates]